MHDTAKREKLRFEAEDDIAAVDHRLPERFEDADQIDEFLATPSQALIDDMAAVDGDILILGVAGKMGPTLARLARNAAPDKKIVGVARFSDPALRERLEGWGIETITADLLDAGQVGHATLDTFRVEPLPADHPYWRHPDVTVTPHVASETRPASAARVIAENIRRGEAGEAFLHLVDRDAGY